MNYKESIKYIEYTKNQLRQIDNSRMKKLMKELDNPQDKLSFIHVGGTNGKGSCVASLTSILINAGYKVGMYTSPHLVKYEERMKVNDKCISQKKFAQIAEKVKGVTDKMKETPTVFEKLTAMAFEYFYEAKVDVVILEVGLGGRLDATNVIKKPDLCILMNIGLEHTEVLGDTISKIAKEKSGIIKENSNVVCYKSSKEAIDIFKEAAKEKHANLRVADFKKIKIKKEGLNGQVFDYGDIKNIELSLLGKHQFKNAATVIEACSALKEIGYKITLNDVKEGLKNVTWDARLSIMCKKPLFILDGAHNPQCTEALKESLPTLLKNKKAIMLCGVLKDKDYKSLMKAMIPFAKEFVCLTPGSYRALKAEDLADELRKKKQVATPVSSIEEGIKLSLTKAKKNGVIVAFGSLYLVGYIHDVFNKLYKK